MTDPTQYYENFVYGNKTYHRDALDKTPIEKTDNGRLRVFLGHALGNILPSRLIYWENYDDPMLVLRDLFAPKEEKEKYEEHYYPRNFITVSEDKQKGAGKMEKTIYGKLYDELKDKIKKLKEEEEDLEFIIENMEELVNNVEEAVKKTKIKTKKNIEEIISGINKNYEILKNLNNFKLDYITFLLKEKKDKKIYKENMKKIKKLHNENKSLKSIKEIKLFNKKVFELKNKLYSSNR